MLQLRGLQGHKIVSGVQRLIYLNHFALYIQLLKTTGSTLYVKYNAKS